MKTLFAISLLTLSLNTFADQCQYISQESAITALKLISLSHTNANGVLSFCQNCEDLTPVKKEITQINMVKTGVQNAPIEININGQGIDLAYTYVSITNGTWVNLGKLANCHVEGASQFITEVKSLDGKIEYLPSAIY